MAGSAVVDRKTGDVIAPDGHRARERSVEALYRRYFGAIREKCRRMLFDPQEAEDVAQETFTRLWHRGPSTDSAETLLPWVYATSTRLAVDRLRRRRIAGRLDSEHASAAIPSYAPDEVLATRELLEQLARRLSARDLAVAILIRLDGLTQPEAARTMATSERTIRRVVTRLDAQLAALGHEDRS